MGPLTRRRGKAVTTVRRVASAALLDRLPDARLGRRGRGRRAGGVPAPRVRGRGRERARVHDHGHDAARDRRAALRARAARGLRGRVAARAAGRARGAGRGRDRGVGLAGDARAAGAAERRSSARSSSCASPSTSGSPRSPRSSSAPRTTAARSSPAPAGGWPTSAPRFDADPGERRALAARFLAAAREGDLDGLVALLAPDAVLIGDGGGIARSIPRPMVGAAGDRPRARRVLRPGRRVGRHARTGLGQRPAGLPHARRGRPARQRRRPRHRRRPGHRHPLDAQPGQARPPRRDVDLGLRPSSRSARRS